MLSKHVIIMNNRIFKTLGLLTLLITFSGLVSATTFNQPAATPPTGNIVPLHTGSSQQKTGSFSVNTLLARGIATFNQQVYINNVSPGTGVLRGSGIVGSDNEKVVAFGGIVEGSDPNSTDDDEAYNTSLVGSGRITAEKFLRAGKIAHDATIAEKRSLCADSEGRVVFCQQATSQVDVCANIEGIQTNPPAGMVQEAGICSWYVKPSVPAYAHSVYFIPLGVGGGLNWCPSLGFSTYPEGFVFSSVETLATDVTVYDNSNLEKPITGYAYIVLTPDTGPLIVYVVNSSGQLRESWTCF